LASETLSATGHFQQYQCFILFYNVLYWFLMFLWCFPMFSWLSHVQKIMVYKDNWWIMVNLDVRWYTMIYHDIHIISYDLCFISVHKSLGQQGTVHIRIWFRYVYIE
jgi:hypothetical protein